MPKVSYLNRKEGDAEGRASDWSEVVTRLTTKPPIWLVDDVPDLSGSPLRSEGAGGVEAGGGLMEEEH
ncbi:Ycf68 protein [Spatholobus suberectus]|nr:Ycf68 protein [Spatholobus suberectus]